ncbi:eukaryotic translation initiation factor 2D isoform X2 [Plodia interpunctella]|uniref:eukaryotic translation initiation factor 2D isoform X2 n=1 Tax=Plodia interpunctella TaxID=58824 RepID=UPI002367641E|nr:eukaryotic translation initiation factor 2D isoform X2 [Plodia interpunctella]
MFSKAYKLKSNSTLKNSEKKHLALRIQDEFSNLSEEKVKELVTVKSSAICVKLALHSGDMVAVYTVDGVPVLIETAEQLVPTVCALWKVPDMVPTITVHSPVVPKVLGGASVYLPGVTIPAGGVGFPQFGKGAIVAANTTDNAAAAIVGRAVMSSGDMLLRAAGTCLEAIQVLGDHLCRDHKMGKIERPKLGLPSYGNREPAIDLAADINQLSMKEEWPSLGKRAPEPAPAPVANEPKVILETPRPETPVEDDADETIVTESPVEEDGAPADMDALLRWSLLCFLKLDGKTVELPLKTNLLYKNYLMPLCPPDRPLDVKKSSYKKMSKFMEAMQEEGLVEVREIDRGVSALAGVRLAHPRLRAFRAPATLRMRACPLSRDYVPPAVTDLHCVTAAVAPLLSDHKKGTPLSSATVRNELTEYVKSRQLNSTQNKGAVMLDATLAKILGKQEQECVKWDALMSGVLGRMTAATEMQFADGTVKLVKTKLEPITMTTVTRSGNKKTHFVAKLLCETYGLPKKFVEGADKALNKKK